MSLIFIQNDFVCLWFSLISGRIAFMIFIDVQWSLIHFERFYWFVMNSFWFSLIFNYLLWVFCRFVSNGISLRCPISVFILYKVEIVFYKRVFHIGEVFRVRISAHKGFYHRMGALVVDESQVVFQSQVITSGLNSRDARQQSHTRAFCSFFQSQSRF